MHGQLAIGCIMDGYMYVYYIRMYELDHGIGIQEPACVSQECYPIYPRFCNRLCK